MKTFSLRWTFLLAFTLLVALTAIVSIVNAATLRGLMRQFQTVVDDSTPEVLALNKVNAAVLQIQEKSLSVALLGDSDVMDNDMQTLETATRRLDYWLTQYDKYAPENSAALRRVANEVAQESAVLANMGASNADITEIRAQKAVLQETETTYSAVINSLLDAAQTTLDERRELAITTTQNTENLSMMMLSVSVAGAFLIGLALTLRTLRPIVRLKNIAAQIAAGKNDARIQRYPNDEIGVLAQEFNHMADILASKIQEANAANTFKTQLLARVSHELRTPLGAVIGMAGMLNSQSLRAEQRELVHYILKYAYELHDMVNELLEQSRWEISGKGRKLQLQEMNPRALLEDAVRKCESRALESGVTLQVTCTDDLPETVYADEIKLRHIANNLVTNAIKFTDKGVVTVRGYAPAPEQWAFDVIDTGIGISPEHQAHIFEPFRQVDETNTRSYGGVGLGLAIVKQFITLMGGTISVDSKLGEGSTFTVTLPTEVRRSEARPPQTAANDTGSERKDKDAA